MEEDLKTTVQVNKIDINKNDKVEFCVPIWYRNEQVRLNCKRVKGRIEPVSEFNDEPIAIVCFGPSLNKTWKKIKKFKYIMSCSGSHKFLVDHGIIPTHHIEVDPRPHKIELLGEPQKECTYYPASACHPKYLNHLSGYNVKMWHVFDATEGSIDVIPEGEWMLSGGCGVGLRAFTLSRFLGFKNLHVFGMDGSFEDETKRHTTSHPLDVKRYSTTEYNGKEYKTTPAMLEQATQTFHEMDELVDVRVKFYGEGLVQAMARDYVRKPPTTGSNIAHLKPRTISLEYKELLIQFHEDCLEYGIAGENHVDVILKLKKSINAESILDYGCGKGYLGKHLPFPIYEYDPAIPEKDSYPRAADLVLALHVLEHVEPESLDFVLLDISRCIKNIGYFIVSTNPSSKTLPDGRNAHLIIENEEWWRDVMNKMFNLGSIINKNGILYIIVSKK
jgi:2-polyprenyl-3-methyl-5-hydroxy-6-metoxy-1,4-benzoquinol methylase